MKDNKKIANRGITLIALVITIIVLLILAGVSIATLTGENGILTKSGTAKEQTEIEEAKEQAKLDIAAWTTNKLQNGEDTDLSDSIIKEILNNKDYVAEAKDNSFISKKGKHEILYSDLYKTSTGENGGEVPTPSIPSTVEEAIIAGTVLNENDSVTIKDKYDNEIRVPEGFKIASDSATDVTGGVVIEDVSSGITAGSQFIWIPVGKVKYESGSKTIELNRYTFTADGTPTEQGTNVINSYYQELATSTKGNTTAKDIEAFKTSVATNHGYYMGRYEAGDPTAIKSRTKSSSTTTPMVCKEGQYVYNYITQRQAATLAREMYPDKKFVSDLMNSYAWDTAIVFIQEFSEDGDYAIQKSIQSTLAQTGKATDGSNFDERCNVYDMAGNCYEWTTETSSYAGSIPDSPCVDRGGNCSSGKTSNRSSWRLLFADGYYGDSHSFRPVLYW